MTTATTSNLTSADMATLYGLLTKMNTTELRALNAEVVRIVKGESTKKAKAACAELEVGQKVSFTNTRTGVEITGSIIKINIKTISVRSDASGMWRVPASMIKAA